MSDSVWIGRDASGKIITVCANLCPGYAEEEAASDNTEVVAYLSAPVPKTVLPQDLMGQFTADDMVKIAAAVQGDATGATALLWYSMVAQRDAMLITNARFQTGWQILVQVLGQTRMTAIATALKISP